MRRVVELPFLGERIGIKEEFVRAVVLRRPTYSAAWCVIRDKAEMYRVTVRGTGIHDYFYETLEDIRTQTDLAAHEERLWNRYARGPQLRRAAQTFTDAERAAEALAAVPDHRYDSRTGSYREAPWRDD